MIERGKQERISPAVPEKIGSEAKRRKVSPEVTVSERDDRMTRMLFEQAENELGAMIDRLAQEIKALAERRRVLNERAGEDVKAVSHAWEKVNVAVQEGIDKVDARSGPDFRTRLSSAFRESESADKFMDALLEMREELGLFSGKKKSAIDYILSHGAELTAWRRAKLASNKTNESLRSVREQADALSMRYEQVILQAWDIEEKFRKVGIDATPLPSDLHQRLWEELARYAGVSEEEQEPGQYRNWREAVRASEEARFLNETAQDLVLGKESDIHLVDPREKKDKTA